MYKKKLVEVALPLEAINTSAEKEKQIRHSHPSNLHQYWARRPFTTARAIIWASLVDDPSEHPELFPTEQEQDKERNRLFGLLTELSKWENTNNKEILFRAKEEIKKYNAEIPEFIDPFSGGGALPMEAQRLGLKAHAYDLNPLSVIINKAMVEIPHRFYNVKSVSSNNSYSIQLEEPGITGFTKDLENYAKRLIDETENELGNMYPKVSIDNNGHETTVISWLWTRTVKCPNPACATDVPLAKTFDISTKKGNLHHVEPVFDSNGLSFKVENGKSKIPGTVNRSGAVCPHCGTPINFSYIRSEGVNGRIGTKMMAVVGEAKKGRIYLAPSSEQIQASEIKYPDDYPDAAMANNPRNFNTPIYGMDHFSDLFTARQMTMLTHLSKKIQTVADQCRLDAINAGMADDDKSFEDGGRGAKAYSEAVALYLSLMIDKLTCLHSDLTMWKPLAQCPLSFFGRQAIPMSWDFAEANPFSHSSGSFRVLVEGFIKAVNESFQHQSDFDGIAMQADAQTDCKIRNVLVSTDPPYYDNINYADLSDYFYIWLRYTLKDYFPKLFSTIAVPKNEELVASPYRFDGDSEKAKKHFEDGMLQTCKNLREYTRDDLPLTIYYAYKQSDADDMDDSKASTGWETMLTAIIEAGLSITGTWPVRTERAARNVSIGSNALASSIVLVCKKRDEMAPSTTRGKFIKELKRQLKFSLGKLEGANIAPVDMAQSAIGPGMAIYSKYKAVLESDGSKMSVRSALKIINQELDLYFNQQDSDLRPEDRFCVDLYSQFGFDSIRFGEADTLARAKNTSVEKMSHSGTLFAEKGVVHLIDRDELQDEPDNNKPLWMLTQQLVRAMDKDGVDGAAKFLKEVHGRHESMKSLAYRLYTIAEKKNWAQEAYVYNNLVVAWPEIQDRLAELNSNSYETQTLF